MNNLYYTKNNDKNFYEKFMNDTNCGSFALNIQEWYDPHDCFGEEGSDFAIDVFESTDDLDFTTELLLQRGKEGIEKDFYDEITFIDSPADYVPSKDTELVAFRVGIEEHTNYLNTDFHFRVFRDGRWQEKCGCGPVEDDINLEPDTCWDLYGWIYDSDIVYFIHKLDAA